MLANFITYVSSINHSLFPEKKSEPSPLDEKVQQASRDFFSPITCFLIEGDATLVGLTQGLMGFTSGGQNFLRKESSVKGLEIVNNKIAVIYSNASAQVWINNDDQNWTCHSIDTQNCVITSLKLSDTTLFLGEWNGQIFRMDIPSFEVTDTLSKHTDCVSCLELYDERVLISGSNDGTLILWLPQDEGGIIQLEGHTQEINAINCDQNRILSAANDSTIRIWTKTQEDWNCIHVLDNESGILCLRSYGSRIFTGNYNGRVTVWQTQNENYFSTELLKTGSLITCMQLTDEKLFLGTYGGRLIQMAHGFLER